MVNLFERLDKGRPPPPPKQAQPSPAQTLLDWLQHWAKTTVTAREVYTYGPNSIRNKKTTLSLAQILVEQGWLVPIETRQYNTHEWKIVQRTTSISGAASAAQVR
jgi:hypothetical protein